jgi:hypothetical protein
MISTLLTVVFGLGFFAWCIAVLSAIRIVSLAPKGQKLGVYGKIGWWQFADIRSSLGPDVEPHIRAYQRAFIAFIGLIFIAMIAGTIVGVTTQN